eukprot:UN02118
MDQPNSMGDQPNPMDAQQQQQQQEQQQYTFDAQSLPPQDQEPLLTVEEAIEQLTHDLQQVREDIPGFHQATTRLIEVVQGQEQRSNEQDQRIAKLEQSVAEMKEVILDYQSKQQSWYEHMQLMSEQIKKLEAKLDSQQTQQQQGFVPQPLPQQQNDTLTKITTAPIVDVDGDAARSNDNNNNAMNNNDETDKSSSTQQNNNNTTTNNNNTPTTVDVTAESTSTALKAIANALVQAGLPGSEELAAVLGKLPASIVVAPDDWKHQIQLLTLDTQRWC